MKKLLFGLGVAALVVACTAGEGPPSSGTYTIQFPSTAAAVATDAVQILVFDASNPATSASICDDVLQSRKRGDNLVPEFQNTPVNICEMLRGVKPVTLNYGPKAILAIGLRKANNQFNDFLIGCTVQTIGDGSFVLNVPVTLVDIATSVPDPGDCDSVGDYCSGSCKPN